MASVLSSAASPRRPRGRPTKSQTPVAPPQIIKITALVPLEISTRLKTAAARYRMSVSDVIKRLGRLIPPSGELPEKFL